jgi:hypothetical protein
MSHNPAVTIGSDMVIETAIRAWSSGDDRILDHENCDIMVGAFSYPLVRVGCFGTSMPNSGCGSHHSEINWVDVEWLLLLSYVMLCDDETEELLSKFRFRCWTPRRMDALSSMLRRA